MISASCKRASISLSEITSAPTSSASTCARSRVRLAMIIFFTLCSRKCRATSSMVSPAPTNSTVTVESDSNICRARVQAANATDTALEPMSVSVRTRLATENDFWNMRSSALAFWWPFANPQMLFSPAPKFAVHRAPVNPDHWQRASND